MLLPLGTCNTVGALMHLIRRYIVTTLPPHTSKGKLNPETTFIYALVDPNTQQIRYIGKSDNPRRRMQDHMDDKRKTHRASWLKSLRDKGQKPILMIIEEVPFDIWQERERYWIAFYREQGLDLTNMADGGEGGYLGKEIHERGAAKRRGRNHTEEHKRKIGEGSKGHPVSEATRARFAEMGRNKSEETRRKIGESSKGRTLSPEARAKISAKLKGRGHPHTEETKQLLREKSKGNKSHLGHKHSPEAIAKIKAANDRRFGRNKQSPEQMSLWSDEDAT